MGSYNGMVVTLVAAAAMLLLLSPGVNGYDCNFQYTDTSNGNVWAWDFSPLASKVMDVAKGTVTPGNVDVSFYLSMCGEVTQPCIPSGYVTTAASSTATMFWGTTPTCTKNAAGEPYCNQGPGINASSCCTQPCDVIADTSGVEFTSPYNPSLFGTNAATNNYGISAYFYTLTDSDDLDIVCEPSSSAGATVATVYNMVCSPSKEWEVNTILNQGCEFNFTIFTEYACPTLQSSGATTTTTTVAPAGMSGGSVFILILFIAAVLYFGVGTIILKITTDVWQIPNRGMWVAFGGLLRDGVNFLKGGCKKNSAGPYISSTTTGTEQAGGDYTPAGGSGSESLGPSTSSDYASEPYDDL